MSRDYKVYLDDILEAIGKIQEYMAGLSLDDLSGDQKSLDMVETCPSLLAILLRVG